MTDRVPAAALLGRTCLALTLAVLTTMGLTTVSITGASAQPQDECTVEDPQLVSEPAPAFAALGIEEAWRYADGEGVVVAVVDSGVAAQNAHFADALVPGVNILDGDEGADVDIFGHGTAAASIIGAQPVDGSAVVGIAPAAQIQPVRIYYADSAEAEEEDVHITPQRIADGIRWAAENGADIINVSLNTTEDHPDVAAAVDTASENGALVVASSGNRNTSDIEENVSRYPASYDDVLAVSPVDSDGQWWADAAFESDVVDVAAPGQHVPTAFFDAGDCILQPFDASPSTSWATAHVSGVAALIASRYPDEGPQQWAYRLQVTASRASTGASDGRIGWGIIRPVEALQFIDDGTAPGPQSPEYGTADAQPAPDADPDLNVSDDPFAAAQQTARWWLIGGLGVGALALLLARLRRSRRPSR